MFYRYEPLPDDSPTLELALEPREGAAHAESTEHPGDEKESTGTPAMPSIHAGHW
jgi:hypothetical protein